MLFYIELVQIVYACKYVNMLFKLWRK